MGIGITIDLLNKPERNKADRREAVLAARKDADDLAAVLNKKADVAQYVIHESLIAKLKWDKIDLVFPLVKDRDERKSLASLLTGEGIPFVGAGVMGLGIGEDPLLAAGILKQQNLPYRRVYMASSVVDLAKIDAEYPLILTAEDDAVFVEDEEALYEKAKALFDVAPVIYVREPLKGKKVHVAAIGNGDDVKIMAASDEDLSENETAEVASLAKKVFELFQFRDMGYFEMEVADNAAYVVEAVAFPELSPEGDFMAAARARGMSRDEVIFSIVDAALARTGAELKDRSDGFLATAKTRLKDMDGLLKEEEERLSEFYSREAKERIDRFQEEAKEMRHHLDESMEGADEAAKEAQLAANAAMDQAKDAAKERLQRVGEGARETIYKAKRYAKERMDEAQADAKAETAAAAEAYGEESDIRELKRRYAALERRVYALEERIRFLENR